MCFFVEYYSDTCPYFLLIVVFCQLLSFSKMYYKIAFFIEKLVLYFKTCNNNFMILYLPSAY